MLKKKKKEFVDGLDVGFEKKYETSMTVRCDAEQLDWERPVTETKKTVQQVWQGGGD